MEFGIRQIKGDVSSTNGIFDVPGRCVFNFECGMEHVLLKTFKGSFIARFWLKLRFVFFDVDVQKNSWNTKKRQILGRILVASFYLK